MRSSTRTPASGRAAPPRRLGRRFADAAILEQRLRGDRLRLRMRDHSSALRTKPAQPPAAWIASSSARPVQARALASAAFALRWRRSTASAASRWFGKLQWMLIQPSCTAIEAAQRIPHRRQRLAVDAQVARAAQRKRGGAQVRRRRAALEARAARRSETATPSAASAAGSAAADAIVRRQHRILACDLRLRRPDISGGKKLGKRGLRHR